MPVLIPEYPSHQPVKSINLLSGFIQQHQYASPLMLIGSSLGGYYAQYLGATLEAVKKVVMINPALQPQQTLAPVVGKQSNMVTGEPFEFRRDDLEELATFDKPASQIAVPTLVLLDEGDDIIDFHFAKQKYASLGQAKVIAYPGGSHWFEHLEEALPEILRFYKSDENNLI